MRRRLSIVLLVLLALVLRVYGEVVYDDFGFDKARQLLMAQSFAAGRGFALCIADPADLAADRCQQVDQWPIGYPLAIAALDVATGAPMRSALLLDLAGIAVLVWALQTVLRAVGTPPRATAWFWVFTGLTFTPYYDLGSTDLLSAALYLLSLALALRGLLDRGHRPGRFVAIGLLLFAAAALRYAYYPMAAVPPALLLLAGLRARDRRLCGAALLAAAVAAVLLAGLLAAHVLVFGEAMRPVTSGATYPANLLHVAPFAIQAVVYTDVLTANLHRLLPALDTAVRAVLLLASAVLLAVVLAPCGPALRAEHGRRWPAPASVFHVILAATLLANVALLAYASYTQPPQTGWTDYFTHVATTRYYAPSMLLIQLGLVIAVGGAPGWCRRVARTIAVLALGAAIAYAGYRAVKVHVLGDEPTNAYRQRVVAEAIRRIRAVCAGDLSRAVYTDFKDEHATCLLAIRTGIRIVIDSDLLLHAPLRTTKPLQLFCTFSDHLTPEQRAFVAEHAAERVAKLPGAVLYRVAVPR